MVLPLGTTLVRCGHTGWQEHRVTELGAQAWLFHSLVVCEPGSESALFKERDRGSGAAEERKEQLIQAAAGRAVGATDGSPGVFREVAVMAA
mmetsp:Transcript_4784/g.13072  ORF Transcript_4784/g.13072 Transcript_4784/m.13072 type:complete len:92 (+) Transcript_4784:674-949(+)|eukprot:scaffold46162_cov19-Tisochrysis_lutea.AAC.4